MARPFISVPAPWTHALIPASQSLDVTTRIHNKPFMRVFL